MNGCILPVGRVVASTEVAEMFERDRWFSGSTWDAQPPVAATIVANIEAMIDEGAVEHGAEMGRRLRAGLEQLRDRHPCIGRIGGHGLYHAVDLVRGDTRSLRRTARSTSRAMPARRPPTIRRTRPPSTACGSPGSCRTRSRWRCCAAVTADEIDLTLEAFDAGLDVIDQRYAS